MICKSCSLFEDHSVFCVTGGNSASSSNRNPPLGGDSVAAAISWNFSDSRITSNKKMLSLCTNKIQKYVFTLEQNFKLVLIHEIIFKYIHLKFKIRQQNLKHTII
ncbi:hypothetical protein C0J52_27476 [Blattella germanica]|nr:hypothetical protein C0J52_27476 [Blattella germanica]